MRRLLIVAGLARRGKALLTREYQGFELPASLR